MYTWGKWNKSCTLCTSPKQSNVCDINRVQRWRRRRGAGAEVYQHFGASAAPRPSLPRRIRPAPRTRDAPLLRRTNLENSFYRHEGIHPEPEFRGLLHTAGYQFLPAKLLLELRCYSFCRPVWISCIRWVYADRVRQRIFDYVKFFRQVVSRSLYAQEQGFVCELYATWNSDAIRLTDLKTMTQLILSWL